MSVPFTPLYIDGEWRPSSTGATFDVHNPTTREVVGSAAAASADDCAAAVKAAGEAFKSWEKTPLGMRRDILLKASDILATKREQVWTSFREETAGTKDWLWVNFEFCIDQLRDMAAATLLLKGTTMPSAIPGGQAFIQRRAIGPVLSIVPWNAPMILTLRAVAVPIVCGNTVVIAPASQHCMSTDRDGRRAGRSPQRRSEPDQHEEGGCSCAHVGDYRESCSAMKFTGSDVVGRIIAKEAAEYLKPCVFELGGKAPVVVLNDADIPRAARAIASSALLHSGQISLFKRIRAGDPHFDKAATIGALFSQGSAENAIGMIQDAVKDGARVLVGDLNREGAIMQPHLLVDVKPGMRIWDRETFAPVAIVAVADTVDEVVDLANASDYSLIASLWTRDVYRAFDVASRINASTNNINGPTVHVESHRENGGLGGNTGYGLFMVEDWTQLKMIVLHPEAEPPYPITAGM